MNKPKGLITCTVCGYEFRDNSTVYGPECPNCESTGESLEKEPVTYTEEEIDLLLNRFGMELAQALVRREISYSSNGIAQFVIDYLKKKSS